MKDFMNENSRKIEQLWQLVGIYNDTHTIE